MKTTPPIDRILDAVQRTTGFHPLQSQSGWSAQCPAHDDNQPSLSISEGRGGRVLICCHAGCETPLIVAAIGAEMCDLMPQSGSAVGETPITPQKQEVSPTTEGRDSPKRTFPDAGSAVVNLEQKRGKASRFSSYHDVEGQLSGMVVRWDRDDGSKEIRPISRHNDGWAITAMPRPRPLYRLNEVREALANGCRTVLVVEGEGVAECGQAIIDAIDEEPIVTVTTWAGGSSSVEASDWSVMAVSGLQVVIIPDHDDPGRKAASTLTRVLERLSPRPLIKITELADVWPEVPEGGDLLDYADAHDAMEPHTMLDNLLNSATKTETVSPNTYSTNNGPGTLREEALYGLAGEIVHTIEPHSEADPVALLIQILIAFGNVINRGPHFVAEADRHYSNLFTVLVGETSKGRKGTSWGHVRRLFQGIDPEWEQNNIANGLSSGAGLIWRVRDPITNCGANGVTKVIDDGVADKRLLVMESEFASVLRVMSREKNTLSAVIRNAWDGSALGTLTKNSPTEATDVHISIVGHVTRDELLRYLTETEAGNGFGNRFLWMCVKRSKCLPEGGSLTEADLAPLVERLRTAVTYAQQVLEIRRDEEARELWARVYPTLSEGGRGMVGAMTSRGEAQVMRLACLYALLDQSSDIGSAHLKAALAVWDYSDKSTRYIFGDKKGDPIADTILTKLKERFPDELTQTDISRLFHGHQGASKIEQVLQTLERDGLVTRQTAETGGRPVTWWCATES